MLTGVRERSRVADASADAHLLALPAERRSKIFW
jgi:hypothetical protein